MPTANPSFDHDEFSRLVTEKLDSLMGVGGTRYTGTLQWLRLASITQTLLGGVTEGNFV